jgi:thiamine-phosphate pyrophosphorylase
MLAFTDPARTPGVEALALSLPRGAGLVYRAFGAVEAESVARRLKTIARRRGLLLLIGADAALALKIGADGVHLPERLAGQGAGLRRKGLLVTAAAHSPRAARVPGVDAVVVSAVFPSNSPSAGKPIGPARLAAIARATPRPVYALGGVTNETARRLLSTGVMGLAGIDGFRT